MKNGKERILKLLLNHKLQHYRQTVIKIRHVWPVCRIAHRQSASHFLLHNQNQSMFIGLTTSLINGNAFWLFWVPYLMIISNTFILCSNIFILSWMFKLGSIENKEFAIWQIFWSMGKMQIGMEMIHFPSPLITFYSYPIWYGIRSFLLKSRRQIIYKTRWKMQK